MRTTRRLPLNETDHAVPEARRISLNSGKVLPAQTGADGVAIAGKLPAPASQPRNAVDE